VCAVDSVTCLANRSDSCFVWKVQFTNREFKKKNKKFTGRPPAQLCGGFRRAGKSDDRRTRLYCGPIDQGLMRGRTGQRKKGDRRSRGNDQRQRNEASKSRKSQQHVDRSLGGQMNYKASGDEVDRDAYIVTRPSVAHQSAYKNHAIDGAYLEMGVLSCYNYCDLYIKFPLFL
jgi:hypothetical protein